MNNLDFEDLVSRHRKQVRKYIIQMEVPDDRGECLEAFRKASEEMNEESPMWKVQEMIYNGLVKAGVPIYSYFDLQFFMNKLMERPGIRSASTVMSVRNIADMFDEQEKFAYDIAPSMVEKMEQEYQNQVLQDMLESGEQPTGGTSLFDQFKNIADEEPEGEGKED